MIAKKIEKIYAFVGTYNDPVLGELNGIVQIEFGGKVYPVVYGSLAQVINVMDPAKAYAAMSGYKIKLVEFSNAITVMDDITEPG